LISQARARASTVMMEQDRKRAKALAKATHPEGIAAE
jgi:hypothetical protein